MGGALLVLALGIAVFEAVYLHVDYASFFSGWLGVAEGVAAWCVVFAVLFWRRHCDRLLGAVGAAVGAQALLALLHMLTLPSTMARPLLGRRPLDEVAVEVATHFAPAFWVGCGGLLLVALPVYLRRA